MNRKTIVLVLLAFAFFLGGAADELFGLTENALAVQWTHMLVTVFLIFLWYRFDSDDRTFRRPPLLSIGVVALAVVALPIYLFMSRGAKGGFISLGWMLLYSMVCVACAAAGSTLAFATSAA